MNGRRRNLQGQGMIESSYGLFKKTLRQLLKPYNTEDWLLHIFSAQSAVNKRAVRSRGGLIPYSLYFGSIEGQIRAGDELFKHVSRRNQQVN